MKRELKFRVYAEISPEILGMKYFDLSDTSERNDTVMQFTGLLYRHGKEIYEGDIVVLNEAENKEIGAVEYGTANAFDGCCSFSEMIGFYVKIKNNNSLLFNYNGRHLSQDNTIEVIGNIYQNLELLPYAN